MKLQKIDNIRVGQIWANKRFYYLITEVEYNDSTHKHNVIFKVFEFDFPDIKFSYYDYVPELFLKNNTNLIGFLNITHKVEDNKLIEIPRKRFEIHDIVSVGIDYHTPGRGSDSCEGIIIDKIKFKEQYYEEHVHYDDYGYKTQTIEEFYKNLKIECTQYEEQIKKDGYVYKVLTLDSDNYDGFPKNIVADFFDEDMELVEDIAIFGVNYEIVNNKLIKE